MRKELKYAILLNVLPPVVWAFLNLLRSTLRITYVNRQPVDEGLQRGENFIFCFWHGRLLLMPFAAPRHRVKVLISRHRDGEFITRVVGYFGLGAVRGSYRKGGAGSVREILRCLREGFNIAITPDGPKGPRHTFKKGIVELAQMTGKAIVPLAFGARKKKLFTPGIDSFFPSLSQPSFSSAAIPSV